MRRRFEFSTPTDVFLDPVVQLAALCPVCALAALRPEAALAALAPGLVLFNPAINPAAALAAFALDPLPRPAGSASSRRRREDGPLVPGRLPAGTGPPPRRRRRRVSAAAGAWWCGVEGAGGLFSSEG